MQELTEKSICSTLTEAEIQTPDWVWIAKAIGFQLCGQASSSTFIKEWSTFAHESLPSWGKLANVLDKLEVKKPTMGKLRDRTGIVVLKRCYTCLNTFKVATM